MKKALAVFAVVLSLGMTAALDAEAARRLGGGKSVGMQRQATTQPAQAPGAPAATPQAPAAANAPAAAPNAATAAAQPKRSWMGPVAGLAAGLGIAALASHFGFGEALANMLTIALVVMGVLMLVGFLLRKRTAGQGQQPAWAAAGTGGSGDAPAPAAGTDRGQPALRTAHGEPQASPARGSVIGARIGAGLAPAAAATPGALPADFDVPAFVRGAKANFMDLQAANDAGDLARLRQYLTPAMYDAVREDIATRGEAPQKTEVFGLEAQVLEVAQDGAGYVVSVRFTGSIRHAHGEAIEDLQEVWHLTRPREGDAGWVVAGIQQA